MKLLVCPECKEVISEGTLCGNNPNCFSCRMRQNRDDLIEIDTASVVESQRQGSTFNQRDQKSNYDSIGMGMMLERRGPVAQMEAGIPVIHALNELRLGRNMFWEQNAGDYGLSQTLVIKPSGSGGKSMLLFSLLWLGVTVPLLGFFLFSLVHDPSSITVNHRPGKSSDLAFFIIFPVVFWGIGIAMLYFSVTSCFSKTWIEIDDNYLYIERGLKRSGKKKKVRRSMRTDVSMYSNVNVNHQPIYAVKLTDDKDVKIGGGMDYSRASEVVYLLKTLLRAEL